MAAIGVVLRFLDHFPVKKKTRSVLSPMFTWWIPEIVMWKKIFYLQGWILILVVNAPSSMIRSNFDHKIHDVQWLNPELSWSNSWSATVKAGFWNPYNITCSYIFLTNHRIRRVYSTDFKSIIHLLQNPRTPQFFMVEIGSIHHFPHGFPMAELPRTGGLHPIFTWTAPWRPCCRRCRSPRWPSWWSSAWIRWPSLGEPGSHGWLWLV